MPCCQCLQSMRGRGGYLFCWGFGLLEPVLEANVHAVEAELESRLDIVLVFIQFLTGQARDVVTDDKSCHKVGESSKDVVCVHLVEPCSHKGVNITGSVRFAPGAPRV